MSFAQARTHCTQASMRLPSLKELLTIVDEEPHREYDDDRLEEVTKMIDGAAFPNTPSGAFWTSSTAGVDRAWTVSFLDGVTYTAELGSIAYVRCVDDTP
jgi:hypothetical protein